jgi:hypothetical protein
MKTWCLAAALLMIPTPASAQGPAFAIEGGGGYTGFADDGIVGHSLIAAAARIYLLPRVSIGPEFQYLAGERDHRDLMLTGNLYVDLSERGPGRPVVPYLVVGGGLFQTRDNFSATRSRRAKAGSRPAPACASPSTATSTWRRSSAAAGSRTFACR